MKKKILIIENDHDIRNIVEFILSEEGFKTLSIPEPQTLAEVLQFKPDLLMIDEFINSKPGHRLCLRIKSEPHLAHLPVIVLIATECKANDYIRKPFDVEEMVDKVIRVIGDQPLSLH